MKMKTFSPVVAVAVVGIMLFGCASSGTGSDNTTTMSETQTMEGDVAAEAEMEAEANINYDDMFEPLGSTKQFDIVALANSNEHLTTFVELMEKADITRVLKSNGPFTVFIPTNNAFNKLSKEEFNKLLQPENKTQLIQVLQAHVIPSKVYASNFRNSQIIETAEGNSITVQVDPNKNVTIGGARIVKPNVEVSNGVIHIVDGVIMTDKAKGGLIDR